MNLGILLCGILFLILSTSTAFLPTYGYEEEERGMFSWMKFGSKCKADSKGAWSYRGKNGPKNWKEKFPDCNGKEQSPIAISSFHAIPDSSLTKLSMNNYDIPVAKAAIENNGHTVQVTPKDNIRRTIFIDGETYNLLQLHFHWGDAYYHGSEHTIDGVAFSLEMHLVHKNAKNQLAVVGVLFQEQSQSSLEMQKIIKEFPEVMYGGARTEIKESLNLNNLLPSNPASYYRYPGSLTTPGCSEGVTWSVIPKALPVGMNQMAEFRKLYSATKTDASPNCKLSGNYRPVQPLNHRKVFISE